jgi:catalase
MLFMIENVRYTTNDNTAVFSNQMKTETQVGKLKLIKN